MTEILGALAASENIEHDAAALREILEASNFAIPKPQGEPTGNLSGYNIWRQDMKQAGHTVEKGEWGELGAAQKKLYNDRAKAFNIDNGRTAERAKTKTGGTKVASSWNNFCSERKQQAADAGLPKRTHVMNKEEWDSFTQEEKDAFKR